MRDSSHTRQERNLRMHAKQHVSRVRPCYDLLITRHGTYLLLSPGFSPWSDRVLIEMLAQCFGLHKSTIPTPDGVEVVQV